MKNLDMPKRFRTPLVTRLNKNQAWLRAAIQPYFLDLPHDVPSVAFHSICSVKPCLWGHDSLTNLCDTTQHRYDLPLL